MTWNLTEVEKKAIEAQSLASFPVNVEEIRRTVSALLSEFGRYGFFDEYTVHSFDHIHEMLRCLDWLIPSDTRFILTQADWFLLTLACYFHDLGLLVTRDEFEARDQSTFRPFCEKTLFSGPDGPDYQAKVYELDLTQRDKFLYQEFVRYHHAARVRNWIIGTPTVALGQAQAAAEEINRLLSPLDHLLRVDLANICESHNLDDLDSAQKYPLYRPYGRTEDESANLQYTAVLLRTADLIQITNQRAPTVLYKLINPKDPTSQVEWLKQNAVKHIRPQPKIDRSGEVSRDIQSDTIEIYADFKNSDGFFGLTSYLQYAEKELQRSFELVERSKKAIPKKYSFPWRYVDDGHIKTEGFLPKKYGFELDQERILDLLTGHTLYNDSAVVLRELAQNAIDAVRLQAFEHAQDSNKVGKVEIRWNSKKAELEVLDNGTGMTQEIIEKHLLKVGSSRYQDQKFKEDHPEFSPISRFGIGVLSAFMIADTVEIITCSTKDEQARQISLRSVHGRYLIRLLDKNADADAIALLPHGTRFKLKLRASAVKVDILASVRRWIVLPRCNVTVTIDDGPPTIIGFHSAKAALEYYLSELSAELVNKAQYKVEERYASGLTLAYALRFDPLFRDWSFITLPDTFHFPGDETLNELELPGICIEGIAVQFTPPGFKRGGVVSIANATGATAPKTNVARSSLENTPESREITRKVYDIFAEQLDGEMGRLIQSERYSLSWATNQLEYLAAPFISRDDTVADSESLTRSLAKLRVLLLEESDQRRPVSLDELKGKGTFWTTHSLLTSSVELLVRELPGNVTAKSVFALATGGLSHLPVGPFLANIEGGSMALGMISDHFEIQEMQGSESDRYLQLRWSAIGKEEKWLSSREIGSLMFQFNYRAASAISQFFEERSRRGILSTLPSVFIPMSSIVFTGLQSYAAVNALGHVYFQPDIPVIGCIRKMLGDRSFERLAGVFIYLNSVQSLLLYARSPEKNEIRTRLEQMFRDLAARGLDDYVPDWPTFSESAQGSTLRLFDPLAWSSRNTSEGG